MKKPKNRNQKIISLVILVALLLGITTHFFFLKEARLEDIYFKEILMNHTETFIPHEIYFSIINPKFKNIECNITLFLENKGVVNETSHGVGKIPARTKLKYQLPFNIPLGNTSINLIKNCTIT